MNPLDLAGMFGARDRLIAVGVGLLLILVVAVGVMVWGQSRYDAGVRDTDAKWKAAGLELARKAEASGRIADVREANRIEAHTAAVAEEREKIDEAVAAGDSPLDVLFGGR